MVDVLLSLGMFEVISSPPAAGFGVHTRLAPSWWRASSRPMRQTETMRGRWQPQQPRCVKRVRVEAGEEGRIGGCLVIYGDFMELIADLELIYHS